MFKNKFLQSSALALTLMVFAGVTANAQAITEGFDAITTLPASGWATSNQSTTVGTTGWFQGNGTTIPAQAGAATSAIQANFNNTTASNDISNWLIAPNRTLRNGDVVKFWTRTVAASAFPDRLQVRLSTAGTSTNVGVGPAAVGDFTTLLLDINPTIAIGGYPEAWTEQTITLSGLPGAGVSGRVALRYFVTFAGPLGDNSNIIAVDTFSYTPAAVLTPGDAPVDFNGDGKTDWVVTRNTGGGAAGQLTWFWNINGGGATTASAWGLNTDTLTPADYDGDLKDDIAIWRTGAALSAGFYILNSATNTVRFEQFGQTSDNPTVVNDYNGDGKDDVAVWRPSDGRWYWRTVAAGAVNSIIWGTSGDIVAPGDYDGDGKADFGIQRAGQFWIRTSLGVNQPVQTFGLPTDTVITADFDGDSKTDIATWRAGTWYWRPSSGGADQQRTFGIAGDVPAVGDYDGDAKADPAVFRNGVFYVLNSTNGAPSFFTLGAAADRAPASYNAH
jgi:hypothetical protein